MNSSLSDKELLCFIQDGSETHLDKVIERYRATAYRILMDLLGDEDLVQSSVPKVFSLLYRYILDEKGNAVTLEALVHRASYNICFDSFTPGFSRTGIEELESEGANLPVEEEVDEFI